MDDRTNGIGRADSGSSTAPDHRAARLRGHAIGLIALLGLSAVTCFYGLSSGPVLGDHEAINALAARQSIQSGHWLIPHLDDVPRIRKPPLGIWLIGAASFLTGSPNGGPPVTEFSARLPSGLAALATVLVVCWLGSMLYGRRQGVVAGFVWAGCAATILYARNAQVDMVLTLFTSLAFAFFWRGVMGPHRRRLFMAAFYVAFALAMLAKAPLPLVTVGLSLAIYWFVTVGLLEGSREAAERSGVGSVELGSIFKRQLFGIGVLWIVPGTVLFLIVFGAWPIYVTAHVDHALALWRTEYLDRYTGALSDRTRPIWYYFPILLGLTAPFMASVPEALAAPFLNRYAHQRRGLAYVFTWAIVGTVFLSTAAFKRPHYLLSVIPAYCLMLAPVIDRVFFGTLSVAGRTARTLYAVTPLLLGVGGIAGSFLVRKHYPDVATSYNLAASLGWLLWTAACLAYWRRRRLVSFALLNLGVPAMLVVMWPALKGSADFNPEAPALVEALRRHGVETSDEIFWVDRRPNAAVEFYSGYKIRRLVNELEAAACQKGRAKVSQAVAEMIVRRVTEKLRERRPVFLVLRAKNYRRICRTENLNSAVLCRLDGSDARAGDELMVITQRESGAAVGESAPAESLRLTGDAGSEHNE